MVLESAISLVTMVMQRNGSRARSVILSSLLTLIRTAQNIEKLEMAIYRLGSYKGCQKTDNRLTNLIKFSKQTEIAEEMLKFAKAIQLKSKLIVNS